MVLNATGIAIGKQDLFDPSKPLRGTSHGLRSEDKFPASDVPIKGAGLLAAHVH